MCFLLPNCAGRLSWSCRPIEIVRMGENQKEPSLRASFSQIIGTWPVILEGIKRPPMLTSLRPWGWACEGSSLRSRVLKPILEIAPIPDAQHKGSVLLAGGPPESRGRYFGDVPSVGGRGTAWPPRPVLVLQSCSRHRVSSLLYAGSS